MTAICRLESGWYRFIERGGDVIYSQKGLITTRDMNKSGRHFDIHNCVFLNFNRSLYQHTIVPYTKLIISLYFGCRNLCLRTKDNNFECQKPLVLFLRARKVQMNKKLWLKCLLLLNLPCT